MLLKIGTQIICCQDIPKIMNFSLEKWFQAFFNLHPLAQSLKRIFHDIDLLKDIIH